MKRRKLKAFWHPLRFLAPFNLPALKQVQLYSFLLMSILCPRLGMTLVILWLMFGT